MRDPLSQKVPHFNVKNKSNFSKLKNISQTEVTIFIDLRFPTTRLFSCLINYRYMSLGAGISKYFCWITYEQESKNKWLNEIFHLVPPVKFGLSSSSLLQKSQVFFVKNVHCYKLKFDINHYQIKIIIIEVIIKFNFIKELHQFLLKVDGE